MSEYILVVVKSVVIQFREAEDEVQYMKDKGLNPNEVARESLRQTLRTFHAMDRYEKIKQLRIRFVKPPEQIIREDRDSH